MNRIPHNPMNMPPLKSWDRAMQIAQQRTKEAKAIPSWIEKNRMQGQQPVRA